MQKSFKLDQAFVINVEEKSHCIFKSGRLSLRYSAYVKTIFGSLSNRNIENRQITSSNYTVSTVRVRQNWRQKAFGRSTPYQE